MGIEILVPILGIILIMIPVAGLTFALTLRFAGKPFVETLAQALRLSGSVGRGDDSQFEALSEQVESLAAEVRRLGEGQRFDRELLTERTAPVEHP